MAFEVVTCFQFAQWMVYSESNRETEEAFIIVIDRDAKTGKLFINQGAEVSISGKYGLMINNQPMTHFKANEILKGDDVLKPFMVFFQESKTSELSVSPSSPSLRSSS